MSEKNSIEVRNDEKFMRMAIAEAQRALDKGEVPIGAVVVVGDRVIGRGHTLWRRWWMLRHTPRCRP